MKHYLALCCIAKDEDHFLKEWLAYHALLGVEHFYVYDNCSATPIRQLLGNFADESRVTIRRVPGEGIQLAAYDDCLRSFGDICKWIGFIDVDEFVVPMFDNDLRVLLSEYEAYGGLGITWRLFGPSGHLKRPSGPVVKNYTQALAVQESFHIKSFVQPARTERSLNPHYFGYRPGHFCVNEDHYPISPRQQCTFSLGRTVRVNHYFLKSQQDFEHKIRRGRGAVSAAEATWNYSLTMFYDGAKKSWIEETDALRFLAPLEKSLRKNALPPLSAPEFPQDIATDKLLEAAFAFNAAGQREKAAACLCVPNPEHAENPDFWTLRALLAYASGNLARADVFIRQSLIREGTKTGFAHLRTLLEQQGNSDLAKGVATVLERYPDYFS